MAQPGYDLLDLIMDLITYIEKELGGKARFTDDESVACITINWEKYDELHSKTLQFNHKIAYSELIMAKEPSVIGQILVEEYRKQMDYLLKGEKE